MSKKLKAYLAHPFATKDSPEEAEIIEILESRGIEVVNPFDGEDEMLATHGIKNYWEEPRYEIARELWKKDLRQVRTCDMTVAYMPITSTGTAAEVQYALDWQKRKRRNRNSEPYLIQIICPRQHPIIAFAIANGNQHFESIEAFRKLRQWRWD